MRYVFRGALRVLALWLVMPSAAASGRTAFSDTVHAYRMLAEWRFEEARTIVARLEKTAPNSAETRYLRAELAFIDGAYDRVPSLLDSVEDSVANGNVGRLRELANSTFSVTRAFAHRVSSRGHFTIFYPPGKDEVLVDLISDTLETAYDVLGADLGVFPSRRLRVEILAKPSDLAKLSPLTTSEIETTGTIALCKYGKLMIVSPRATLFGYPWLDTVVHEYTHYLVSRASHDQVPIWLHEGLARFQQTRWRKPPMVALSAADEHLLASALERAKLISFDEMHPSMAKLPSQRAAALAFAEVYTMVAYIHERVGYQGIRELLALHRNGRGSTRAVADVLGVSWKRVQRDWKSFLRGRKLQVSSGLVGRASARRIRFDKRGRTTSGRAENVGIDEISGREARRYARLGGMLRARGMADAAAVEYEKALAASGRAEPFLATKLSRTYLDLSRYDKAIELAEPLVRADENDAAPAVTLGLAHLAQGHLDTARAAFEAALRVSPFDPAVRCSLADIYRDLKHASRAERERHACELLRP